MADMRVKISDGTTTVDLFGGSDSIAREGGISMPPPEVKASYVSSAFSDGARMSASRYDNRVITITCKIVGTDKADLKTNVRQLQRILNDATKRYLLGHGTTYYLEVQWGDTAGQSTFFDILRGDLEMPENYMSVLLKDKYTILNARLILTCKPFGRYTNQTIAQATLENSQSTYDIEQSYLTGDDSNETIDAANDWCCQTFTPSATCTVPKIAIKCYQNQDPDITAEIYATSGGEPTGSAIATGTAEIDGWPDVADTDWIDWLVITLASPVELTGSQVYALVIRCANAAAATHKLYWRYDNDDASYAGGQRLFSTDGGANWTAHANDDHLFAIYKTETGQANYQDITTAEAYGDVPARMYIKLAQSSAAGTVKVWIAKRTGTRQTDDLWIEGEDANSVTKIIAQACDFDDYASLSSGSSGDAHETVALEAAGDVAADTEISRMNFTISTLPKGQFRVLVHCRVRAQDSADYDHMGWGFGWSYGDRTYAPSDSLGEYYACAADSTWEILDLGILNIPPIADSDIASDNSFELRIYQYSLELLTQDEIHRWDLDYIFLLPIDEGVVIVDDVAAADVLASDGISDPPKVFVLSAADKIEDTPDYVGAPLTLGRENTRIYVLRDDDKDMSFASDITYQPQFLVI